MCGFVVWVDPRGEVDPRTLIRMRDTITHRGPDSEGLYISDGHHTGLGFRRLSIIDLSAAGNQPLRNEDGTIWITFNGEVYNFIELRHELKSKGHLFTSGSDAEVALHAYEEWGERSVDRFVGMFAFVIWNERERTLFAVRDRLGIKPLYYTVDSNRILLASQLKPLLAAPDFNRDLDQFSLREYLQQGYISTPRSIFKSVRQLKPGHTLGWSYSSTEPRIQQYWDPLAYFRPDHKRLGKPDQVWVDELDGLLRSAVRYRLISDVPLAAFLSGGVDSSLITAIMRQVSTGDVRSYTIGFADAKYDEGKYAEVIARHLDTKHETLTVTKKEAQDIIPHIPEYYDEPFADSSQIPTYLVSKLARRHVKVGLSGDGGDELFFGYTKYHNMSRWRYIWKIPQWLRSSISFIGRRIPNGRMNLAMIGLAAPNPLAFVDYYTNAWRPHEVNKLAPSLSTTGKTDEVQGERHLIINHPDMDLVDMMMMSDIKNYLPNDILTKVDRASMAVSLETRVPLLDHRIVEFALQLPTELKWHRGIPKVILKQVLSRYVPLEMIERPKHGFAIPLDNWLREDLSKLVYQFLDTSKIKQTGLFDPEVVRDQVHRFMDGRCSHTRVWTLLMFQMWFERYGLS